MNFQQQPQMQQPNPFGGPAPASPASTWQQHGTVPQKQQPPQSADPFAAFGASATAPPAMTPMPVPMSPQQQQQQQQQQQRMPTSPMAMTASPVQQQQQQQRDVSVASPNAGTPSMGAPPADPFASFGVPQVSPQPQPQPQAHQAQQAQENPMALMQGQAPSMGLRQPSLGTAEMQPPAPALAPAPTNPFGMAPAQGDTATNPFGAATSPQVQAQPPAPVAAPAPAPANDPWNINAYGPPAEAPADAPPAPPMEAPPAPPVPEAPTGHGIPPTMMQGHQAPPLSPVAPAAPVQQQQAGALVVQPNAAAQGQQQQAYANYNLGTGYVQAPPEQAPASPFGATQHVVPVSPVPNPASPMQQQQQQQQQMVASPGMAAQQAPAGGDPFGMFNQQQQQPQPQQLPQQSPVPGAAPTSPVAQANEDFWGDFAASPTPTAGGAPTPAAQQQKPTGPLTFDANGFPEGGEYYNARIHVAKLGVLFFKATDLAKSLFADANPAAVNAIGKHATVGHVFDGSAAEASGIGLGHVLLKVNGVECQSADEAAHLIKTAPRPLHLECYAPPKEHCQAAVFASKHMVKYDDKGRYAPQSMWEWKPKYVVIGGVIADPLQMNMYRSKAEYDTAVMEVQSGQSHVSVKVKQFGLHNATLVNDQNGQPRTVEYREKWHYLCIVPEHGNPIKIAATKPERLDKIRTGMLKAQEHFRLQEMADRKEAQDYAASMQAAAPAPSYNASYNAYGGNHLHSQQQQQQQQQQAYQQQAYQQPAPQEISYGQGYEENYQGYAQPAPPPPQQQQQQQLQYSSGATPWASY